MSEHVYYTCAPKYECQNKGYGCQFCDGGLSWCTICDGFEGTLTKECPGVRMTEEEQDAVYKTGTLDFKDGKWYNPKE